MYIIIIISVRLSAQNSSVTVRWVSKYTQSKFCYATYPRSVAHRFRYQEIWKDEIKIERNSCVPVSGKTFY